MVEKHNGVWGGCWCTWFHRAPGTAKPADDNRAHKESLVRAGKAPVALLFHGDDAVAWCEYGSPDELPHIYHLKEYSAGLTELPNYRITCLFVDRDYRRTGVAAVALAGALDLIAQSGGGVVEAYPHDTQGKQTSSSFLYNGTRSLFEKAGFSCERSVGKKNCVMRKVVSPS